MCCPMDLDVHFPGGYKPISDKVFIIKLIHLIRKQKLIDFYLNNQWEEFVLSRSEFSPKEARILDCEAGYLMAVYDKIIPPPSEDVKELIERCNNDDPTNLREKAFYHLLCAFDYQDDAFDYQDDQPKVSKIKAHKLDPKKMPNIIMPPVVKRGPATNAEILGPPKLEIKIGAGRFWR